MDDTKQTSARPFKCPSCDKAFTRQENLKRHVNTHHSGFNARSFKCTLCNARFARSDLRKRHIENCHVQSFSASKATVPESPVTSAAVEQSPSTSAWLEILMAAPAPFNPAPAPVVQQSFSPLGEQISSMSNEALCISAFFTSFHRNFPVLHEASFHVISAQAPLLNAITCIGSMYCPSTFTEQSRNALFESTLSAIQSYVEQNRSRYQETWVLQTFLLIEYLGIYGGDDASFLKAQRIHRDLVDAIRMLQMSHDGTSSFQDSSDEAEELEENVEEFESLESLESRWQDFVKSETRKRCIYALYLLDSQLSILCNLRPMLSSLEIKYDLPCCEDMWLAKSAEAWSTSQKQQFKSFNDHDDQSYTYETPPSQGFFYEASQTLLHSDREKKHPRKLRLLWASPFAAVILVIQLQMMARELTHASCLLERPKSQRRTLSVLTDKQHAQISQALKGIAELVPRHQKLSFNLFDLGNTHNYPDSDDETPLWHTFWILWYYTSITLSHPDSLLVSGIVEVNLPLAIATAGHLATPRSKDKRDIYEDRDVFRILNDLELALELLNPARSKVIPALENTFITLLGFKICLVGWRLVRLTMGEAAEAAKCGTRSNPCKFVLDAIMSCCDTHEDALMLGQEYAQPREIMRSEVYFLEWIVESFKKRSSWPVGKWVTAVMEERLATVAEAYAVSVNPA